MRAIPNKVIDFISRALLDQEFGLPQGSILGEGDSDSLFTSAQPATVRYE